MKKGSNKRSKFIERDSNQKKTSRINTKALNTKVHGDTWNSIRDQT